ncbi:MAG: HEAT repeat domain-containing protein [Planctomycetaceae bacterium]
MRLLVLLPLAAAAVADRGADLAVAGAMREYYAMLGPGAGEGGIESVRDRLVANFAAASPDTQKSVLRQIDRGFEPKYGKSDAFCAVLCEILAGCGRGGINTLRNRVKASSKRPELRTAAAGALGRCGNEEALDLLLQMSFDAEPGVAAAAVTGCAAHAKIKHEKRKAAMRRLVDLYLKATNETSGKAPESRELKLYNALRPAMNETLKAFSGGEELDSAQAWDAWLRENIGKRWEEAETSDG